MIAGLEDREYHRRYQRKWYVKNAEKKLASTNASRDANPSKTALNSAKGRAKRGNFEFTITALDVPVPEFCPVLGIPLFRTKGAGPRDNTPSVDRINNALGYVPGNVIVISMRANQIKNNASIAELRQIADFYERKSCGL